MPLDLPLHKLWLPPKPAIIRALSREELVLGFLPGFIPPGVIAPRLSTLTQVDSATNLDSVTITGPASIIAGDLLVLADVAGNTNGSGNPTTAVPTNFNIITNNTFTTSTLPARKISSFKIATGAEASASLSGLSGSVFEAKMLYVFRGNARILAAAAFDSAFQFTTGTPTDQTVTSGSGVAPLIAFGTYGSTGTISPRGFSPTKDGEINPNVNNYLAYKIFNMFSPLSDVVVSMQDEGENHLSSFYIACA